MQHNHNIPPDDSRGRPRVVNQSSGITQPLPRQDLLMQMAHAQDTYHRRPPSDFHPVYRNREDGMISDRDAMMQASDLNQYAQYLSQSISGDDLHHSYDGHHGGGEHYYQTHMTPLQPPQHQAGSSYGGYIGQQYQPYSSDQETYIDSLASIAPQQSGPQSHSVAEENAFSRTINNVRRQNMAFGGEGFLGYPGRNPVNQPGQNEMYNSDDFIRMYQSQQQRLQNVMHNQLDTPDIPSYQHIQQQNYHHESSHPYMSQTQPIGSIGYQGPASSSIITSNVLAPSRPGHHSMRYPDTTISPEYFSMGDDNTPQRIDRQQTYTLDINGNNATASRSHDERMKGLPMLGGVKRAMDPLLSLSHGEPKPYVAPVPEPPPKKKRPSRKKPKDMPRRPFSAYNLFFSEERVRILGELKTPPKGERKQAEDDEGGDKKPPAFPFESNEEDPNAPCAALLKPLVKTEGKRRPHRKTHGKVSFRELAVQVGARWRALPPQERKYYQELADKDLLRHKAAMEKYYEKQSQDKQAKLKAEQEEDLETQRAGSAGSINDDEGDENEKDDSIHPEGDLEQRPQTGGRDKSPPSVTRVS